MCCVILHEAKDKSMDEPRDNKLHTETINKQAHSESADLFGQDSSLPPYWSDSFATKYPQTVIFQALEERTPQPRLDHNLDHYQNLITCSFYHIKPKHKISTQSNRNFLSNFLQTDKQTNKQTNAIKNITSFSGEINIHCIQNIN